MAAAAERPPRTRLVDARSLSRVNRKNEPQSIHFSSDGQWILVHRVTTRADSPEPLRQEIDRISLYPADHRQPPTVLFLNARRTLLEENGEVRIISARCTGVWEDRWKEMLRACHRVEAVCFFTVDSIERILTVHRINSTAKEHLFVVWDIERLIPLFWIVCDWDVFFYIREFVHHDDFSGHRICVNPLSSNCLLLSGPRNFLCLQMNSTSLKLQSGAMWHDAETDLLSVSESFDGAFLLVSSIPYYGAPVRTKMYKKHVHFDERFFYTEDDVFFVLQTGERTRSVPSTKGIFLKNRQAALFLHEMECKLSIHSFDVSRWTPDASVFEWICERTIFLNAQPVMHLSYRPPLLLARDDSYVIVAGVGFLSLVYLQSQRPSLRINLLCDTMEELQSVLNEFGRYVELPGNSGTFVLTAYRFSENRFKTKRGLLRDAIQALSSPEASLSQPVYRLADPKGRPRKVHVLFDAFISMVLRVRKQYSMEDAEVQGISKLFFLPDEILSIIFNFAFKCEWTMENALENLGL